MPPTKRLRVVAQIEIFLIASREPSLQQVVVDLHQHFVDTTKEALKRLGVQGHLDERRTRPLKSPNAGRRVAMHSVVNSRALSSCHKPRAGHLLGFTPL